MSGLIHSLTAIRACIARLAAVTLLLVTGFVVVAGFPLSPVHAEDAHAVMADAGDAGDAKDINAIVNELNLTGKVLGGANAEPGDWPSVVALLRSGFQSRKNRFFCGGTVVADRWVMTAAHCLYDAFDRVETPSDLRIVAGEYDLEDDEPVEEIQVTNVIVHPDYDNSLQPPPHDIALLELASSVNVPISQLFAEDAEAYTDTLSYIAGWGATQFVNETAATFPSILQEARVPLVSLEMCNSPVSYNGLVGFRQLCAGFQQGGVDTCAGDSGGPLYIIENGASVQIGITSFGNGCAQEDFYGIYTSVSHYLPWLGNYIAVPPQSAELLAARDAQAAEEASGYVAEQEDVGFFGGTVHLSGVLLLALYVFARCGRRRILLAIITVLGLGLSACTARAIEVEQAAGISTIYLTGQSMRPGIESVRLGDQRATIMSSLLAADWQTPVCRVGKIAMKRTGRLFQLEQCEIQPSVESYLAGQRIDSLALVLIDDELVRLDVRWERHESTTYTAELSTDAVESSSNPASSAAVNKAIATELDQHYARVDETLEWRQDKDQVRLAPGVGLLFIDGRLEARLPALYDDVPLLFNEL
ncbi:MAG: serine protease [Granulosicoccus sp.]|nr:serine protease [Granulosicoccus sp.]